MTGFETALRQFFFQVFLLAFSVAIASSQELSVFDQINECDLLAAHPDDTKRMAQGVADDEIVPLLAIEACEKAIEDNPNVPRFMFQLGRSFLAYGEKKKAVEMFRRARKGGYALAYAYLGDAYHFGLGVEKDPSKALDLYEVSIKAGFEEAKEQVKRLKFDPALFVSQEIGSIFKKDFESVKRASDKTHFRNYLFNFAQTLITECGSFLTPKNVPGMFFYRYPPGWTLKKEGENIVIAIQTSVGEFDAEVFLKRYGCEGVIAEAFMKNLDQFFSGYSKTMSSYRPAE